MPGPWEEGPKELLQHAIDHLTLGGDFDRRIAMISTDNAVEIMMKTFLSLPKRVLGTTRPTRKEIEDAKNSFPAVLDLIEKYAGDKLAGVNLEEIEWYHRIRNEIYHSGHGVTVELTQIHTYLELATLLFENLFGTPLKLTLIDLKQQRIGKFLALWNKAQSIFREKGPAKPAGEYAYYWNRECLERLSLKSAAMWEDLHEVRDKLVYHQESITEKDLDNACKEASELIDILEAWNPK